MVGNKTLQRYYAEYNRRYFGNSLPKCKTVWADLEKLSEGAVGHYRPVEYERFDGKRWHHYRTDHLIEIDPKLRSMNTIWQSTLLHEMAHLSVGLRHKKVVSHGKIWQQEMLRLATAGAFKNLW